MLEVLISLAFFLCLAALFCSNFSYALLYQKQAERITIAVNLAEQSLEEVKAQDWSFFTPGSKREQLKIADLPSGYRVEILVLPTENELLREIKIIVYYQKKQLQLTSLISYYSVIREEI